VQKLIAEWNTDLKLWGNLETDLLSERWVPFLETWPTSGTMRNGQVFELPMPTHPIKGLESSSLPTPRANEPGSTSAGYGDSLNDFASRITVGYARKDLETLPTPKARDNQAEGYEAGLRRSSPQVGTIVKGLVEGDDRVLLRSPKASEGQGGALGEAEARRRGNTVGVRDQVMDLVASQGLQVSRSELNTLFPTPTTRDYKDGSQPHERDGKVQTDTVARAVLNSGEVILPTPTTNGNERKGPNYSSAGILQALEIANGILPKEYTDWEHARQKIKWAETLEGQDKKTLDSEISWGKFGPAIQLWEKHIGRKSPAPTKPDGKQGNHRLSSKFTEWMMGLPDGWITDVGLTRNEELKLAGNGVVPQQAELALRLLLENNEGQD
jgi:hypothetical protein